MNFWKKWKITTHYFKTSSCKFEMYMHLWRKNIQSFSNNPFMTKQLGKTTMWRSRLQVFFHLVKISVRAKNINQSTPTMCSNKMKQMVLINKTLRKKKITSNQTATYYWSRQEKNQKTPSRACLLSSHPLQKLKIVLM